MRFCKYCGEPRDEHERLPLPRPYLGHPRVVAIRMCQLVVSSDGTLRSPRLDPILNERDADDSPTVDLPEAA